MRNILFFFHNNTSAEQTVKYLISNGVEFNFKITNSKDEFIYQLKEFNPEVVLAESTKDALNHLKIIKIANEYNPNIQLIILSSKVNNEEEIECLNAGAFDYLSSKNMDRLLISINRVIYQIQLGEISNSSINSDKQFYKSIIEQAPDAIFRGNYLGEFKEVNTAACELTGYSRKELLSMKMRDLFTTDQLTDKPLQYDLIDKGKTVINERIMIHKNGNNIPINMNTKLINSTTYFCIMRDLTDQNRIKKVLKEKEERMRNIIEHSSNLFYSHNPDGKFTYVSPKTIDFFDCDPEYFIEMNSSLYSDNPINNIGKLSTKEAIKTGITQAPFELELEGKKGRRIWVEVHEEPVISEGKVTEIVGALVDITESKKTSDMLKKSEKKFRTLFLEAPQGIFLTDNKGIIIDYNRAFCNIIECGEESLVNTRITELLFDEGIEEFNLKFPLLMKSGKIEGELFFKTKKGNKVLTHRSVSALYDDNGEYSGAIVHIIDITHQKKIQAQITESETKLRAIFNASDNISFILSDMSTGKPIITEFSPGAEALFGYSRDEVIGKSSSLFHIDKNKTKIEDYISLLNSGEKSIKEKIDMVRKSSETFTALHTAYPLKNELGIMNQLLTVAIDLTNVIEIEKELKKREEQLTTLINASPDIICIKDGNGKWLMANEALMNRLNLGIKELKNKTNTEISSKYPHLAEPMYRFSQTDEIAWSNQNTNITEETLKGENNIIYFFEIIKVPVYHSDGKRKALVIIGRDTTRRKQLESQLQHSQKMEAIGLMAGGIAHNFNNILQAIVGYIDFAKEGLEEESQRYKDVEQISQHVKRATQLTKNLMAVGKDQFLDKTEIDISDIIQPIVDLTNRNNTNNIQVEFTSEKNLPSINADGSQLDQVIMNLVINSSDAMPAGGKITVNTNTIFIDEDFCIVNAWAKPGSYIKIDITDTGQGMDEDTKRRIFEPYFTTKGLDKGTGLGLSTAFGIISQHNGLVNVISSLHKGTTFEIYLPVFI